METPDNQLNEDFNINQQNIENQEISNEIDEYLLHPVEDISSHNEQNKLEIPKRK